MLRVMLTEDNDLPSGGPRLVNGLDSAAVALQAVFGTQAGEWPFDLLFGMRWRQEVFGKYFDANATNQAAAATANTVPDIQPVTGNQITLDTITQADIQPVTGNQITLDTITQADARQVDITIDDIQLRTATGAPASLTISVTL